MEIISVEFMWVQDPGPSTKSLKKLLIKQIEDWLDDERSAK